MASLRNYKQLKASSITESVIAISIISICVLVAFLIYLNVVKYNSPIGFYKAKQQVEFLIEEAIHTSDFSDNNYTYDSYKIDKVVVLNNDGTATIKFSIKAGEKTYVLNKLINYEVE